MCTYHFTHSNPCMACGSHIGHGNSWAPQSADLVLTSSLEYTFKLRIHLVLIFIYIL